MNTNELKACLDAEGRLLRLPVKRRKRLAALAWLAEQIPAEGRYTEREFNELLNRLHTFGDPATLRRELFDFFLIHRSPDGTDYRVNPERPSLEELVAKYC